MNLFQKQQTTSGYASIPNAIADNETATVPLGTTIVPRPATTTMTSGHRAKLWMAIAAGLLLVTGVVVLRDRETAAEGLIVVATTDVRSNRCIPAGDTFNGNSYITLDGTVDHFETCYKYGSYDKYCWTKSYLDTSGFGGDDLFKQCVPDPKGGQWRAIHQRDMKYVNPVTHPYSCGDPCHGQHEK